MGIKIVASEGEINGRQLIAKMACVIAWSGTYISGDIQHTLVWL